MASDALVRANELAMMIRTGDDAALLLLQALAQVAIANELERLNEAIARGFVANPGDYGRIHIWPEGAP